MTLRYPKKVAKQIKTDPDADHCRCKTILPASNTILSTVCNRRYYVACIESNATINHDNKLADFVVYFNCFALDMIINRLRI